MSVLKKYENGEWIAVTTGAKGETGNTGPQGIQGETGPAGADGADGADGLGVPPGGTTGQVLAKASATDNDTTWVDQSGGATTINDLTDVDTSSVAPTDGQALVWDGTALKWEPGTIEGGSGSFGGDLAGSNLIDSSREYVEIGSDSNKNRVRLNAQPFTDGNTYSDFGPIVEIDIPNSYDPSSNINPWNTNWFQWTYQTDNITGWSSTTNGYRRPELQWHFGNVANTDSVQSATQSIGSNQWQSFNLQQRQVAYDTETNQIEQVTVPIMGYDAGFYQSGYNGQAGGFARAAVQFGTPLLAQNGSKTEYANSGNSGHLFWGNFANSFVIGGNNGFWPVPQMVVNVDPNDASLSTINFANDSEWSDVISNATAQYGSAWTTTLIFLRSGNDAAGDITFTRAAYSGHYSIVDPDPAPSWISGQDVVTSRPATTDGKAWYYVKYTCVNQTVLREFELKEF